MPAIAETTRIAFAAALQTAFASTAGTLGQIFYVDSTNANGSNSTGYGTLKDKPFLTLAYAFSSDVLTANNGDTVIVAAGHSETGTAAAMIDMDIAGVTVIGCGHGTSKPTFTLGTATTCDIDIDAANIRLINLRFVSAIDDLAVILDVNEGNFTMEDCDFYAAATLEVLNFINLATTKDNFIFRRCFFVQEADPTGTDGAANTGAIYLVDTEHVLIEDCQFHGFFETAIIHNKTTACKYLTTRRCCLNQQLGTTAARWVFPTGTVGVQIDHENDPCFNGGLGYLVQKTEAVDTATSDDLFTTVGKVDIHLWHMEVTQALGAAVTDYTITLTTLAGSVIAAGNIASAIIGFMRNINQDSTDTALSTSSGAVSVGGVADTQGKAGHLVIGRAGLVADILKAVRTAGDAGDAIVHSVYWRPLEVGANIRTAA